MPESPRRPSAARPTRRAPLAADRKIDWAAIGEVVRAVGIPVIANGGIGCREDVEACSEQTGAAAVMSSEGLLENPALFCSNRHPSTGEYLDQTALARA